MNNPSQPVVGVTYYEAQAYCRWLTAQLGDPIFRPPSEMEHEAATRGQMGRKYAYGDLIDVAKSNTFESHIRRTTPIGIFANATPEGIYDLSSNVYTWTTSQHHQVQYPYSYRSDDGSESQKSIVRQVLRGGAWNNDQDVARASYRSYDSPDGRDDDVGFRLCCSIL